MVWFLSTNAVLALYLDLLGRVLAMHACIQDIYAQSVFHATPFSPGKFTPINQCIMLSSQVHSYIRLQHLQTMRQIAILVIRKTDALL